MKKPNALQQFVILKTPLMPMKHAASASRVLPSANRLSRESVSQLSFPETYMPSRDGDEWAGWLPFEGLVLAIAR